MEKITRREFLKRLFTTGSLLAVDMMVNRLAFAEAVDPRKITDDIWKSIDFSPERINPYLYKNILGHYEKPVFAFCDTGIDLRLIGELPNIKLVGESADYDVMTERLEFHGTWMVQAYTGIYGGIRTMSPFVGSNFQDSLDINCYNLMHYDSAKGITPLPNARDMFLRSKIVVNSLHTVLHREAPNEFNYFRSRKGIVITSAGNYDSPTQAAYALPEDVVLRVGALDENMNPAGYSVWKKPDGTPMNMIFAPGFLVAKDPNQDIYKMVYGTSCAAQWVGMTAKLIQMVNPFLNGEEIKGIILKSCNRVSVNNIDPVIAERYPNGILILGTHQAVVNADAERLKEKIFIPMIN